MSEKILLVDDEEANLKLLIQWLIPLGYDIELASNGEEAVQKTRSSRPDLIILDIMMPVMDGYEACRILKADPETKNIPIIMVTALHERESKLKGLSVSANDFLSKPIDQTELTIRVKNLLNIKAYEDFMLRHNQMLKEELIHSNKMSALGMLVSSIAHEVNNPNNFIMFNSSLLSGVWKDIAAILDRYAAEDPTFRIAGLPNTEMREAIPKLLAGITDGSRRIKDMVSRLRELSCEDRSGLDGVIDVNAAVRSAVMIMENQIEKYSENFALELAESLPSVRGSNQQIEQVVINIIQNALQALCDRQGMVTVKTFSDNAKHQSVIEVRDSGQGISTQNLKRIKEPFFTTKLDLGGTGLGLYISNSIIQDHHGALDIQSEEGRGTTVRVHLPGKEV